MHATATQTAKPRMRVRYEDEVVPALQSSFNYRSPMELPRITKITLNMGIGQAKESGAVLENAVEQLATIAGQRPNVRRARKSIASFKVREGMPVGLGVTLRGARMWEFFDRLVSVAIPRIRDFRGLNARSFDGRGNYSMGVREQLIFPEINIDAIDEVRGLDVTITTSAKTDEEAFELLSGLGMPFAAAGRPGGDRAEQRADEQAEAERLEEARAKAEDEQSAFQELKEENPEAYEATADQEAPTVDPSAGAQDQGDDSPTDSADGS